MAAVFLQSIKNGNVRIQNSDSTNLVTVLTAGASGTKIDNITITSTDTSAKTLTMYKTIGGVDYILGTLSVTANSGNSTTAPTLSFLTHSNVMGGYNTDANGNKYFYLENGAVLKAAVTASVTSARFIHIQAQGFDL